MSKQEKRINLLEEKIRQLEIYHFTKCPPNKVKIVDRLIRKYSFRLQHLNALYLQENKMISVKLYTATVKHDKGIATIRVAAQNKKEAKEIIMQNEGCPARAILKIEKGIK